MPEENVKGVACGWFLAVSSLSPSVESVIVDRKYLQINQSQKQTQMKASFPLYSLLLCTWLTAWPTFAQIRLPKLIGNGMVLQHNAETKIWGWASANEKVTVTFLGQTHETQTNDNGEWQIVLHGLPPGGPYSMTLKASNVIELNDIWAGDVWLCSGQSNMELPLRRVTPLYEKELAGYENDQIRMFAVPQTYNFHAPKTDLVSGSWKPATQANLMEFSAVAFFFAKALHDKYGIPIGLINSSLGGSPAEAWMSEKALKQFPAHYNELQRFKDDALIGEIEKSDNQRIGEWYLRSWQKDQGRENADTPWQSPVLNTSEWDSMYLPGYWADTPMGATNGVAWFRKKVDIPASMAKQPAKLNLGRIIDADSVWINGHFVGSVGYQYPPRWYQVPANVLEQGANTIVVRVISNAGKGGFVPGKPYELIANGQRIDLTGTWQYKLGSAMDPLAPQTFVRWKPGGLYNAMLAPLLNYSVKGVIWYQGESNADRPDEYKTLFPALISNWRDEFKQPELPFLFVQLPNFMETSAQPSESNWAKMREAQLQTLSLPHTGMAVAYDLGEWNDIHPMNKKDVGIRLAVAAQKVAYGNNVVYSGPAFKSYKTKGNHIELTFDHIGSGLVAKKGTLLTHFAIAGADRQFVWAEARIKGRKVQVWDASVAKPLAVRYAWADNPQGANLYNKEGLPASPFRTDNW
ncbi:MAG: sialate O-acetylesterase [Breznakibacter sp.]